MIRTRYNLLQGNVTGVIVSVGNDTKDFLIFSGFLARVIERHRDRVAHGGAAPGIDTRQALLQFVHVVSERHIQVGIVVEIDDKNLVLPVGVSHQFEGSRFYAGTLSAHAAAVINDEAQRNRYVFAAENLYLLRLPILKDFESTLIEIRYELSLFVGHTSMQDNQSCV